jgi:hypothetical protein
MSHPEKTRKQETENLPTNMDGMSMKPKRFGALDLKHQAPISSLMPPKLSNT